MLAGYPHEDLDTPNRIIQLYNTFFLPYMEKQIHRLRLDNHIHVMFAEVTDGTGPATGKHETPAIKQAPT